MLPVRSPAVARQGAGELDAVHLRATREAATAAAAWDTFRVECNSCHDELRQTVFYEPRAPAAHRLGDGTGSPALSASATMARASATAAGRSGAATQTRQMISSAVCALMTLAFRRDAALLTAAANVVGSGWSSSLVTRTVTSYLLGGLSMPGTVSVVHDIFGR